MSELNDLKALVGIDPEIMSGAPVFAGTRVPVQTLFDYLQGGDGIDEFLSDFPSVSSEQAHQVLACAGNGFLHQAARLCA